MNLKPRELENMNSAYQFVGYDDCGNKEYLVNVKENTHSNKTATNLDDCLFDGWDFEDDAPENENDKNDVMHTPEIIEDDKTLTRNDFFKIEWKEAQYQLYRLLVNISSSLSDIKEVAKDGNK